MSTVRSSFAPVVALALVAACAPGTPDTPDIDPRLASDLARASAAYVELAPRVGTPVVTAAEIVPQSAVQPRASASAPVPARRAPSPVVTEERVVEPSPVTAPAPEPAVIASVPMPVDAPSSAPRPQAPDVVPVSGPEQGGDTGGGIGGWIGVVIRGGMGGWDDCAAHDRARRGGRAGGVHISINERMPSGAAGVPVSVGTVGGSPRVEMGRPRMPARGGMLRPGGFR